MNDENIIQNLFYFIYSMYIRWCRSREWELHPSSDQNVPAPAKAPQHCVIEPSPVSLLSVLCLLSHVSCLTSSVSHLLSHISCLTSPVSRLLSHASCLPPPVSCFLSPVSCFSCLLLSPVSCLLSPVTAADLIHNDLSGFSGFM